MDLFFSEDIRPPLIILPPEESNHCIRVLRLRKDDPGGVINGKGVLFHCVIVEENPRSCKLEIVSKEVFEKTGQTSVHIAIAPTKNSDRFEWFLEKATEIGIDEITPVICEHSERRKVNAERSRKVLISAIKQSQKVFLPVLNSHCTFKELLEKQIPGMKFIAWCGTGKEESLATLYKKGSSATILVGPEGDFSPEEVSSAIKAGWIPVSLGSSRLRTETAGVVACHTINLINGS